MTTSTLNYAAQSADSALDAERAKLDDICRQEANLSSDLDNTRERERGLVRALAEKGRERAAQENRIAEIERAMTDQAEALIRKMGELGLEPQQPPLPAAQTQPDALGIGHVSPDASPSIYEEQVAAHGQPPTVTQPVPAAAGMEETGTTQQLPSRPVGDGRQVVQVDPEANGGETTMLRVEGGKKVAVKRGQP